MTARRWRHSKMAMSSFALFFFMLGVDQPSAGKFCKDGFVTYSSDAPYTDRVAAEAAAVRAWRTARFGLELPRLRDFPPQDQMQCKLSDDRKHWRCFIRSGPCTAG